MRENQKYKAIKEEIWLLFKLLFYHSFSDCSAIHSEAAETVISGPNF